MRIKNAFTNVMGAIIRFLVFSTITYFTKSQRKNFDYYYYGTENKDLQNEDHWPRANDAAVILVLLIIILIWKAVF